MAASRSAQIRALFDGNAAHYDRVNTVICFGQDALWRRWAAGWALAAAAGERVPAGTARQPAILDACGGTGLVALELAQRGAHVTLADLSPGMLEVAADRAVARGLHVDVALSDLTAEPAALLPGAPFAAVTLSFGLRYVDDPAGLVRGLGAALAPGGALVILESVVPPSGLVPGAAGFYFFHVAPRVAGLIAGSGELYRELASTTRALGTVKDLLGHVRRGGLVVTAGRSFAGGTVAGIVARPASGSVALPGT